MAQCFSCRKRADSKQDHCYGCGKTVCVKCAWDYGHMVGGLHGRRPTTRAVDLRQRARPKNKKVSGANH